MNIIESRPSIRVMREVQELSDAWFQSLSSLAAELGISNIRINSELHSTIISPGEVRAMHDKLGIELTSDSVMQLADYLEQNLPSSVDNVVSVPAWPWSLQDSRHKRSRTVLTIATENPVVRAERLAAQTLVNNFNNLQQSPDKNWLENNYVTHIHLARFSGEARHELAALFAKHVKSEGIFPETFVLGEAIIEDV